jgi:hypothetical protein
VTEIIEYYFAAAASHSSKHCLCIVNIEWPIVAGVIQVADHLPDSACSESSCCHS